MLWFGGTIITVVSFPVAARVREEQIHGQSEEAEKAKLRMCGCTTCLLWPEGRERVYACIEKWLATEKLT